MARFNPSEVGDKWWVQDLIIDDIAVALIGGYMIPIMAVLHVINTVLLLAN